MVQKPADDVTLSAEEGEVLIAHVHQSNLPAAVAGRLEQIIRTCFWLVFALQETKITLSRLRRLLFGKALNAALSGEAPREDLQRPERGKPTGGYRPGTGRLGADAYVGAERIACRHEKLAPGQRCPVCGQGTF